MKPKPGLGAFMRFSHYFIAPGACRAWHLVTYSFDVLCINSLTYLLTYIKVTCSYLPVAVVSSPDQHTP